MCSSILWKRKKKLVLCIQGCSVKEPQLYANESCVFERYLSIIKLVGKMIFLEQINVQKTNLCCEHVKCANDKTSFIVSYAYWIDFASESGTLPLLPIIFALFHSIIETFSIHIICIVLFIWHWFRSHFNLIIRWRIEMMMEANCFQCLRSRHLLTTFCPQ